MQHRTFLVMIFLVSGGCYNPDYITSQGVTVFNYCGDDCPEQAVVEHALEVFAIEAPELFEWEKVRKYLRKVRLFWYDEQLDCMWSEKGCAGLIFVTAVGRDIKLYWTGEIITSALFHELIKYAVQLDGKPFDFGMESKHWDNLPTLKERYLKTL